MPGARLAQLTGMPGFRSPFSRFGSSDYHRSQSSHLCYSKRRPSFQRFQDSVMTQIEGVEVGRHCMIPQNEEVGRWESARSGAPTRGHF